MFFSFRILYALMAEFTCFSRNFSSKKTVIILFFVLFMNFHNIMTSVCRSIIEEGNKCIEKIGGNASSTQHYLTQPRVREREGDKQDIGIVFRISTFSGFTSARTFPSLSGLAFNSLLSSAFCKHLLLISFNEILARDKSYYFATLYIIHFVLRKYLRASLYFINKACIHRVYYTSLYSSRGKNFPLHRFDLLYR